MEPEFAHPRGSIARIGSAVPQAWHRPVLGLIVGMAALFVLTMEDWAAMAYQWWNISTYNHVLFVPLISGWLIWSRRDGLAKITPQAWWPGLLLFAGALFLWLLGSLADVNTVSQLGAVSALLVLTITLLGVRFAAACAFPLAYFLFLVPIGGELVPSLQMITASLVIVLTEWSNIPAVIDGVFIDTPAGLFEVAEACSGVKFLIAMIALGVLVSYACFESWGRRIIFMGLAISLPILANGVRAWGTIYIAQSQGIQFAEGFDHVFYGWFFFALVVLLLFLAAYRWFDRDPEDVGIDFPDTPSKAWFIRLESLSLSGVKALSGVLALILLFALWSSLASTVEAKVPAVIEASVVDGWQQVAYTPRYPWEPRASGADHRIMARYRDKNGRTVDVFLALYATQEEGREASAAGEGALVPDSAWRWLAPAQTAAPAQAEILFALGQYKRRAETSYRTGDQLTGSPAQLKLANTRDQLLLKAAPTSMLILSTEISDEDQAAAAIADFRKAVGPQGQWIDQITRLR